MMGGPPPPNMGMIPPGMPGGPPGMMGNDGMGNNGPPPSFPPPRGAPPMRGGGIAMPPGARGGFGGGGPTPTAPPPGPDGTAGPGWGMGGQPPGPPGPVQGGLGPPPRGMSSDGIAPHHPPPSSIASHPRRPYGKLTVRVVEAKNLKAGVGVFGRADPYVRLKLGEQSRETDPDSRGGKTPSWEKSGGKKAEFDFELYDEREMKFNVMDKEVVGPDKHMGEAAVSVLDWISSGGYRGKIDLRDKGGKHAGELVISATFRKVDSRGNVDGGDGGGGSGSGGVDDSSRTRPTS